MLTMNMNMNMAGMMMDDGAGSDYSSSGSASGSESGSSSSNSSSSRSSSSGSESSSGSDSSSMSSPTPFPMGPAMVPLPQEMMGHPYGQMIPTQDRGLMLKKQKKHKHRHKKIKDPNAPKRARTAFMQFSVRMREIAKDKLKEDGQDPTPKLVAKKLGEMWRGLNDEQKKPYIEEAEKDKKRYMLEKSQYTPSITQPPTIIYNTNVVPPMAQAQQHTQIQQHQQLPAPLVAAQQHQQQLAQVQSTLVHRRHHPSKHHHSHHSHHGHPQAPQLPQVGPQGLVGLGPQVMHADPAAISGVIMNGSDSDSSSGSDSGARRTHKRKKKDPNAPKRNKSPYIIFTEVFRDNVTKELKAKLGSEFTYKEVLKELGRRWNILNEGEKEQFKILAAEDKKRYEAEIAIYKKKI